MTYQEAYKQLDQIGQSHILQFFKELTAEQQDILLQEIQQTDFSMLSLAQQKTPPAQQGRITPIPAMASSQIKENRSRYEALGLEAVRAGRAAAVLLAGGMGTRLGSDRPKGMYDIGITKELYIFQRIIENLMDTVRQAGRKIHLF